MTNEETLAITFRVDMAASDLLVAELADLGFEAFSEGIEGITAYVAARTFTPELRRRSMQVADALGAMPVAENRLEPENWNAKWEATVEPVVAGGFCVHPPWFAPAEGATGICIEPKMSFGTGHHETTRLMLQFTARLVKPSMRVLDAGTGTGVLAIASLKLGAAAADAFDVDAWSIENAIENARRNGVEEGFETHLGGVEVAPGGPYDVVFANINRNVLIDMLPELVGRLAPGGRIALAGFLRGDRPTMLEALGRNGLQAVDEADEGDWLALVVGRE